MKTSHNYVLYIFMFAIVVSVSYIGSQHDATESFTPHVRKIYRPYVRKARVLSEGFHSQTKSKFENIVRKLKLM